MSAHRRTIIIYNDTQLKIKVKGVTSLPPPGQPGSESAIARFWRDILTIALLLPGLYSTALPITGQY